ncbi:DUF3098 domain-containing protein [bacterium]|nr:DUF3098 domain-containing protein [bacterium]
MDKDRIQEKARKRESRLPFTSANYKIFGTGILMLVLGYVALSIGPWDGFWTLNVAPILLVAAYCVVLPLAILYRKKEKKLDSNSVS